MWDFSIRLFVEWTPLRCSAKMAARLLSATPMNDPMCVDENGLLWLHALMAKESPPEGKIGLGYMLQGETAASNIDPFAAPPADGKWSEAGPHIMIFNAKVAMAGYPTAGR